MVKKPEQPENHFPSSSETQRSMSGSRLLLSISYRQYSVAGLRCYIWMQISSKTSKKASAWSVWSTRNHPSWCHPTLEHLDAACPLLVGSAWAQLPSLLCSLVGLAPLALCCVCQFPSLPSWTILAAPDQELAPLSLSKCCNKPVHVVPAHLT